MGGWQQHLMCWSLLYISGTHYALSSASPSVQYRCETLVSETSNLVAILAHKMLHLHSSIAHILSMYAVSVAVDGTPLQATPAVSSCLALIAFTHHWTVSCNTELVPRPFLSILWITLHANTQNLTDVLISIGLQLAYALSFPISQHCATTTLSTYYVQ